MTDEEAKPLIKNYVNNISRKSGWWIFNKRKFYLDFTNILEPWQKDANLALPKKLAFPHFTISSKGLDFGDFTYKWNEVFGTAIKEEMIGTNSDEQPVIFIRHLIFCLEDGMVIEYDLGDTSHLKNLTGHFIEEYKVEFYRSTNKLKN